MFASLISSHLDGLAYSEIKASPILSHETHISENAPIPVFNLAGTLKCNMIPSDEGLLNPVIITSAASIGYLF